MRVEEQNNSINEEILGNKKQVQHYALHRADLLLGIAIELNAHHDKSYR